MMAFFNLGQKTDAGAAASERAAQLAARRPAQRMAAIPAAQRSRAPIQAPALPPATDVNCDVQGAILARRGVAPGTACPPSPIAVQRIWPSETDISTAESGQTP